MNILRGFWRLWAAASFAWIVVAGGLNWVAIREDAAVLQYRLERAFREPGTPTIDTPFGRFTPSPEMTDFIRSVQRLGEAEAERRMAERQSLAVTRLSETAALVLGPPVALGLLLFGVGWVARGFRPARR